MSGFDYVIKHDFDYDNNQEVLKKILHSIVIRKIKANKPVVLCIVGGSGSGKSRSALRLQEILCELQGINFEEAYPIMNIHTPLEYSEKLKKLLYDKNYKKVNIVTIHEAREIVPSKEWNSFLVKAIAKVNVMSRAVKRLIIIVVSQYVSDIALDIRKTFNYYISAQRTTGSAWLRIQKFWVDDYDVEKIKTRKASIRGIVINHKGQWISHRPARFKIGSANPVVVRRFDKDDTEAKAKIIDSQLDDLMTDLKTKLGIKTDRVKQMVEWYATRPDLLQEMARNTRGKIKLKPDAVKAHQLTKQEVEQFEKQINQYHEQKLNAEHH